MPFRSQTSFPSPTSRLGGGGLDYITSSTFTTASTVSVDGCFTSSYDNYRLLVRLTAVSGTDVAIGMRMRAASSDASGASDYKIQQLNGANTTPAAIATTTNLFSSVLFGSSTYGTLPTAVIDLFDPYVARVTVLHSTRLAVDNGATYYATVNCGTHALTSAYDGFSLIPGSGTISGTVTVFGYRKA